MVSRTKCYYPACSLRLFKGLISSDPFVPTAGYSTFGTDCKQNFQFTLLERKSNQCTPKLLCKPSQCMVIGIYCKPTLLLPVIWQCSLLGSEEQTRAPIAPELPIPNSIFSLKIFICVFPQKILKSSKD